MHGASPGESEASPPSNPGTVDTPPRAGSASAFNHAVTGALFEECAQCMRVAECRCAHHIAAVEGHGGFGRKHCGSRLTGRHRPRRHAGGWRPPPRCETVSTRATDPSYRPAPRAGAAMGRASEQRASANWAEGHRPTPHSRASRSPTLCNQFAGPSPPAEQDSASRAASVHGRSMSPRTSGRRSARSIARAAPARDRQRDRCAVRRSRRSPLDLRCGGVAVRRGPQSRTE